MRQEICAIIRAPVVVWTCPEPVLLLHVAKCARVTAAALVFVSVPSLIVELVAILRSEPVLWLPLSFGKFPCGRQEIAGVLLVLELEFEPAVGVTEYCWAENAEGLGTDGREGLDFENFWREDNEGDAFVVFVLVPVPASVFEDAEFDVDAILEELDRDDLVRARMRGGISAFTPPECVSTLELASAACLPRR